MNLERTPRGLLRTFYRFPILLYKARLGRLLGGRFLMLTHTGRLSGVPRHAVLEVVAHEPGVWFVAAAYGDRADWFRNILADPRVSVSSRGRSTRATAQVLSVAEAARVLADYARRHPRAARQLGRLMAVPLERDPGAAAERIPVVRLLSHDTTSS